MKFQDFENLNFTKIKKLENEIPTRTTVFIKDFEKIKILEKISWYAAKRVYKMDFNNNKNSFCDEDNSKL
jgi:hypothetical protein